MNPQAKKELTHKMYQAIIKAKSDYLDAVGGDDLMFYTEAAVDVAIEFAKDKVKEQRNIMSNHLNMRNVPNPAIE